MRALLATAIQPGGRVRASIMSADDADLYRLRVQAVLDAGRLSSPVQRFGRVRS